MTTCNNASCAFYKLQIVWWGFLRTNSLLPLFQFLVKHSTLKRKWGKKLPFAHFQKFTCLIGLLCLRGIKQRSGASSNWSLAALTAVMAIHILVSHWSWKGDPTHVQRAGLVHSNTLLRVTPHFLSISSSGNSSLLVRYVNYLVTAKTAASALSIFLDVFVFLSLRKQSLSKVRTQHKTLENVWFPRCV